ncbi:efflux RND transporter periplasmic adaptor subunit [Novosphingobium sp.]|uniref:efflux RND transporter periplasmic adaptor subunit n=1 Tax=Novosphingobium sp. TaxID=1874826 RepID=UPI00260CC2CC|nr:efflux RND transporter periplasmic adaptor subunit [Novosphingobium sp.]
MAQSLFTKAKLYINERPYIYWALAVEAIAAGFFATQAWTDDAAEAAPAPTYVVVEQARPDAASSHGVSGIVQSAQPMQVGAVTGGRVVKLLVNVGDPVIEGQVLAILDGRIAGFRRAQAASEVRRAAIVAIERAAAARRAEALVGSGAMSAAERDAAQAEAHAANNALAAARAASGMARTEAEQHVIRAPGSGVISSRSVELGAAVAPGQTLFGIDSRKGGTIMAALPAKLAPTVRPGDRLVYRTDTGEGLARVTGASSRIEAGGVASVRLAIESGAPLPGTIVGLRFGGQDARGDLVRVPLSALQTSPHGGRFVYTLDPQNRARPVPVQLAGMTGADARVSGRIAPGTGVVAAGAGFLEPGQAVRIAKPGA